MGKNKKRKREKKMFGLFGKKAEPVKEKNTTSGVTNTHGVQRHYTTAYKKVTKPTTGKDNNTLNVVLFKQSSLNKIAEICLPKADGSEFQVHYRALQLIFSSPNTGKRLAFTIPTVFFNMPQTVATASVDFVLNEVAKISNMVAPISEELSNVFANAFPVSLFTGAGFELIARESECGSIHRHPGHFGFSSIDLDNQVSNPGVIFRNLKAEDRIQVDSVMYIPGKQVELVTTETRLVNVEPVDEGIKGSYKTTPTISYIWEDEKIQEGFNEFFSVFENNSDDDENLKFIVDKFQIDKEYPQIQEIFEYFLNHIENEYTPELIIDPNFIKQEINPYQVRHGKKFTRTYGNTYGNIWDNSYYDEYMDLDEEDLEMVTGTQKPTTSNDFSPTYKYKKETPLEVRPTWRKMQVLNALKAKGIDPKVNAMITGDASESDIIAIVTEMKLRMVPDPEIEAFFISMNYPENALEIYRQDLK